MVVAQAAGDKVRAKICYRETLLEGVNSTKPVETISSAVCFFDLESSLDYMCIDVRFLRRTMLGLSITFTFPHLSPSFLRDRQCGIAESLTRACGI